MEALWWDRPFALAGVDIGASVAALHLISSYGAQQDIRIHTDDDGWVDRFDVETQAPSIASWRDVDAVLSKTGARYSFQVAKVDNGRCDPVAGTNTGEPRRWHRSSSCTCYMRWPVRSSTTRCPGMIC